MIPFRRIAIFDAETVFGYPFPLPEYMRGHLFRWFSTALRRGADAVYFRAHEHPTDVVQTWLDWLSEHPAAGRISFLLPLGLHLPNQPFGRHLGEGIEAQSADPEGIHWKGRSCHDAAGIQKALDEGMDYAFLSPVFSTATHPESPALGLEILEQICQNNPDFPIFALGGITPDNEKSCIAAGAFGIAAIRYFS